MLASIEPATVHLQILVVIPDFPRHQDAPLFQELIVAALVDFRALVHLGDLRMSLFNK